MKAFTCTSFQGHWPVGTAAIVIAESSVTARWALMKELEKVGLPQQIALVDLEEIALAKPNVRILCNGDY